MQSIADFFNRLNMVDFKYVVLRNFEHLPYKVEVGPHSDLDLLVYDLEHFEELFSEHLTRVYPHPRVQYRLALGDSYIQIDARYLGDDYYPYEFEKNVLKTREYNKRGFFTPNPLHFRLALAYHAVHHKGKNTYQKHLGDVSVKQLLEALNQNPELGWVEPLDPSVGRFNAYLRGSTSVVSTNGALVTKKQYRFKDHDLIKNEARMLDHMNNRHFPKVKSVSEKELQIEHCGEPLGTHNLPGDWKEQLLGVVSQLEEHGVVHRDVRLENLMVKDGTIKLVDFGWARMADEPDGNVPELLGYPNKCPFGFNDRYSMNNIIKHLEYELCGFSESSETPKPVTTTAS